MLNNITLDPFNFGLVFSTGFTKCTYLRSFAFDEKNNRLIIKIRIEVHIEHLSH